MKELPKEFQFKCDEHSREQCEKLGIDTTIFNLDCIGEYYHSENRKLTFKSPHLFDTHTNILISLSDYLEDTPDHLELIVQLTGQYVEGLTTNDPLRENASYCVESAILLAEETVKQLKERGYLK